MSKNTFFTIAAVTIIIVVAAAAVLILNGNNNDDGNISAYNDSDVRLRIFGNADGNDVIDQNDIKVLERIIKVNNDDDPSNDIDWRKDFYYADADNDGCITEKDVELVQKIIDKEPCKMWYESAFSTRSTYESGENLHYNAYVNYPLGTKVGCEYNTVDFLCALGLYDYYSACDARTPTEYGETTYPGISKLPVMGQFCNLDIQSIGQMYRDGTINTLIMWTGGSSTQYLWDDAVRSGVADDVSIVMLTFQGEHCVNGVLMLACMFGDQSLSDKYVDWYDRIMNKLSVIGDSVEKKTVLAVALFHSTNTSNIWAYKQYLSPALWFSKVFNFVDNCSSGTGSIRLGTPEALQEELESYNITEMVAMTQALAEDNYENLNSWIEKKMHELYQNLPVYENQKIYTIDFGLMPAIGGPAGCMLLAAQLYPDAFSLEEAFDLTQEYIDNFMQVKHDAHYGFTYTGDGYYPYKG